MKRCQWLWMTCVVGLVLTSASHAALVGSNYRDAVLDLNPVGYWEMDDTDASGAVDSSGNANDATFTDGTQATVGQPSAFADLGTSYLFPFAKSAYNVPKEGTGISTGGAFSFVLWFQGGTVGRAMVTKGIQSRGNSGHMDWDIFTRTVNGNDFVTFRGSTGITNDPNVWLVEGSHPGTEGWHFIAVTWDGTTDENGVKIYVNGQLADQGTATSTSLGTGYDLHLGGVQGPMANNTWDGYLDELAMFDYALSGAEVNSLYLAAIPEPASLALMGLGGLMILRRRRA